MTKIKAKPTPSQARILRALRDYSIPDRPLYIMRHTWKPRYQGGEVGAQKLAKIDAPLNRASLKVCDREGWIELFGSEDYKGDRWQWGLSELGLEVVNSLEDDDFITPAPLHKAFDLLNVIEMRHPTPEWVFIRELRMSTGADVRRQKRSPDEGEYIDAFALNCWPSKHFQRVAYEVKVNRGDFLAELKNPDKREPFLRYSNLFYFVAPVGLIKPEEVPDECGLIEIHGDAFWKIKTNAHWRRSERPSWGFLASLARNLSVDYKEYRDRFK